MDPFDVRDDDLRRSWSVKWTLPPAGVLPVWVAEMDARPCPAVQEAVRAAVETGTFGYPPFDALTDLGEVFAGFAAARYGWQVDPALVVSTGDVMAGVRFVLETLCEPAPVVVPVPSYPPLLHVVPLTGRQVVTVPALDADRRLDVGAIEAAFADGARTLLLSNPHNPLGRAWGVAELEALRDAAERHGARVISDEIHGALVLPGATHVPYATIEGTAEHGTTVTSASKAFNIPGLKCAQLVLSSARDAAHWADVGYLAEHGTATPGLFATTAAYRDGREWLDDVVAYLDGELDPPAARRVEAMLAADPALRARVLDAAAAFASSLPPK